MVQLKYDLNQKLTTKDGQIGYYCTTVENDSKDHPYTLVLNAMPAPDAMPSSDTLNVCPENVISESDIESITMGQNRAKACGCTPERWTLIEQSKCCFKAAFVHCGCTCLALMHCPEHGFRHTFPFGNQGASHPG
jgi:hypothetical protein